MFYCAKELNDYKLHQTNFPYFVNSLMKDQEGDPDQHQLKLAPGLHQPRVEVKGKAHL